MSRCTDHISCLRLENSSAIQYYTVTWNIGIVLYILRSLSSVYSLPTDMIFRFKASLRKVVSKAII